MAIFTLSIAGSRVFPLARSHRLVVRSSAQKTLRTDRRPARAGAMKRTGSLAPGCSATQGGTIVASPNQDTKKARMHSCRLGSFILDQRRWGSAEGTALPGIRVL